MGLMIRRRLTQVVSQLPRAASRKQGKYPEEHPGKLQPQNARQPYKRPPCRLAEAFAALRQSCFRLSNLGRRPCSLLSQPNARIRCSRRCLYPSRRVRGGRRIHRRHQRLGGSASPKSQRTSEPNRIHSRSVASRHISVKLSLPKNVIAPYRIQLLSTANATRIRGNTKVKNFIWMAGGFCAAAVGFLIWSPGRPRPIQELAHNLEVAWADHHTVV